MNFSRLGRGELIAAIGAVLLALGLFLPWYETNPGNRHAAIDGARGTLSGWTVHSILHWLLLAAAAAPLILAWVILRDHELSWPRGELTAVIGIVAFVIVVYLGIIDRTGEPPSEISLAYGWFVALLGTILISVGGSYRASTTERPRKPPGVL
jgi:hypothetical protein